MIGQTVRQILKSLPDHVILEAAAKTRTADEVQTAIDAGIKIIGYNYVQEAERIFEIIGNQAQWHSIGHLQKNKVKRAVNLFDMIETVDSLKLAELIDQNCREIGKIMPVLIEVNSGEESNKTGVLPTEVEPLVEKISRLKNIKISGLMTMGPFSADPEDSRPSFKVTKQIFDFLNKSAILNVEMKYLSMGMSNSYKTAIEEGANIIRLGTILFGERRKR